MACLLLWPVMTGCVQNKQPSLLEVGRPMIIAVAPPLNHSASRDFDPLRLADLLASELTFFEGVRVVPLNRVLAQLESENRARIESPSHALSVMERVGADGIVVFAVTEYDPYEPVLGISAQMYSNRPGFSRGLDMVSATRQASPVEFDDTEWPKAESQRVFHGADESLMREIKQFARNRNAGESPYGWQRYLASQDDFARFCCHATANELIRQEVAHVGHQPERQIDSEEHAVVTTSEVALR